jgi:2-keto-4-pentenoate hydratase/2-oxohepta-3-ene-1,7-dioic acid hydratase in catechol pathway
MKLVTYAPLHGDTPRLGAFLPENSALIADLGTGFPSMLALIDAGEAGLSDARARLLRPETTVPRTDVRLLAPLPEPRQVRDAMCFELHYKQGIRGMAALRAGKWLGRAATLLGAARIPRVWYEMPTYYKCNRFSVVGDGADVVWPRGARLMDYELELAVVIGKPGKDIAREDALSHVFGYTIFNDMSARDIQEREIRASLGPAKSKDFDTGNVFGPCIVTRDELTDPYALAMEARVNGALWGRGHSGSMHHRWEDVIAHVSKNETLHAGEIIGSGTVGNGCGLELGRFLQAGDTVELRIAGIGTLTNRLVQPHA